MKRENIFISEDCTTKRISAIKFVAPGDVPNFECLIRFGEEGNDVTMQNCIIKGNNIVKCSPEDTYDFETGALIALMKMCGREKVTKACDELYKDDKYKNALQEVTENLDSLSKKYDLVTAGYDYWKGECKKLDKENEKLKLDCEKLQHEYDLCKNSENALKCSVDYLNKTIAKLNTAIYGYKEDLYKVTKHCTELEAKESILNKQEETIKKREEKLSVYFGGRQNGKQYTALVNLFKNLDQKKVDAAYKEAYNTTLPVWQKEVLNQMYGIYKESKEKIELQGFYIKVKPFTKREEMWIDIFNASKNPPVEIKVAKQDIKAFLRELQDRIPKVRWNGSDCPLAEYTNPYWFKHDYIYFALFRNDDKGNLRICYDEIKHSWIFKPAIDYLPPMRWDLFEKGRLAVKVNYDNYKEFYEACEKELGKKPSTIYAGDYTVSICKKDGNFQIFTIEHQKTTGRKIVDWEDVK